jgi:hypothetical protein
MRYTVKKPGEPKRYATAVETAYIKRLLGLHIRLWKWRAIVALDVLALLILIFKG